MTSIKRNTARRRTACDYLRSTDFEGLQFESAGRAQINWTMVRDSRLTLPSLFFLLRAVKRPHR